MDVVNLSLSRHYDGFILIGLCWLYGRSEFPPPPPLSLSTYSTDGQSESRDSLLVLVPH